MLQPLIDTRTRTAQQVVDRLLTDPGYRVQVAVANNYPAVLDQYRMAFAVSDRERLPDQNTLISRLQWMLEAGQADSVRRIIAVPYLMGKDATMDQAYTQLVHMYRKGGAGDAAGMEPDGAPKMAWIAAIGAIAELVGGMNESAAAQEAAEREEELRRDQAAAALAIEREKSARTREALTYIGLALAAVAAVALIVWYQRRKP